MAQSVGVDLADVSQMLIGGSFGQYINVEKAVQIGLLPDLPAPPGSASPWDRFQFLGNTAIRGAYMALLRRDVRAHLTDIAGMMTYLELSADNSFYDAFTSALVPAPHRHDAVPVGGGGLTRLGAELAFAPWYRDRSSHNEEDCMVTDHTCRRRATHALPAPGHPARWVAGAACGRWCRKDRDALMALFSRPYPQETAVFPQQHRRPSVVATLGREAVDYTQRLPAGGRGRRPDRGQLDAAPGQAATPGTSPRSASSWRRNSGATASARR